MTDTTTWGGPMERVRTRQVAQRVEETQRGTKWVVSRVFSRYEKPEKGAKYVRYEDRFKVISRVLGYAYACDKTEALDRSRKRYSELGQLVVHSASCCTRSMARSATTT